MAIPANPDTSPSVRQVDQKGNCDCATCAMWFRKALLDRMVARRGCDTPPYDAAVPSYESEYGEHDLGGCQSPTATSRP